MQQKKLLIDWQFSHQIDYHNTLQNIIPNILIFVTNK